ncbi:bifunctional metallophosphatase/5'-nucleotidase [Kineosporia mesophila]|uniref:Bifunctional metallophosphatase/5'-nucleotidase n=1 Tax=Kineosporia mesophila TaxID=566012 RepID=A0ABP6ZHD0_9ACTN|nr:bifunctional metallophosphatase/5'-nucleotidase [Kineosporia mesophila]MCD5354215.1 bifunctional metallophosphatase/5'-nucleotidase [Kineosporia mesophila]
MKPLIKRRGGLTAAVAASTVAAALFALPSSPAQASDAAAAKSKPKADKTVDLQILSFNDYHGNLEPPTGTDGTVTTKAGSVLAGGAEYLTNELRTLRKGQKNTLTVAAGDLIGASPSMSGLFKDEPSIETLNNMGVDVSSVGNHEFDEGVTELLRMQYGGCHPTEGCFDDDGYSGADFQYLAANVEYKDGVKVTKPKKAKNYGKWFKARTGRTVLPPTSIKKVDGIKVGFIGMTLEGTTELVAPAGVKDVQFNDEVVSANLAAKDLRKKGVEAIVVLLHEGGIPPTGATYDYDCNSGSAAGISGPIVNIAKTLDSSIDLVVTGHTHNSYNCNIPDPKGNPRLVTSDLSYGRTVTETDLKLSKKTKDVIRTQVTSKNVLVDRDQTKAADQTKVIAKWKALAAPISNKVIGEITADIKRSVSRDGESSLGDLIADAQLSATKAAGDGGSQVAFMNPGGVRTDLTYANGPANEGDGKVTYGESFTVQPFGNLLVSMDVTGAQIDTMLEQQWTTQTDGSIKFLHMGVSDGFTYSYSKSAAVGSKVNASSIKLNGTVINPTSTYRITVNSFLADGGDGFLVLKDGTNRIGGGVDLDAFNAYLTANSPVTGPTPNRVTALD